MEDQKRKTEKEKMRKKGKQKRNEKILENGNGIEAETEWKEQ